jgi:hypothetical protein
MSAIISAASIRPSPNCHHGSATYKKAIDLPTHNWLQQSYGESSLQLLNAIKHYRNNAEFLC